MKRIEKARDRERRRERKLKEEERNQDYAKDRRKDMERGTEWEIGSQVPTALKMKAERKRQSSGQTN